MAFSYFDSDKAVVVERDGLVKIVFGNSKNNCKSDHYYKVSPKHGACNVTILVLIVDDHLLKRLRLDLFRHVRVLINPSEHFLVLPILKQHESVLNFRLY